MIIMPIEHFDGSFFVFFFCILFFCLCFRSYNVSQSDRFVWADHPQNGVFIYLWCEWTSLVWLGLEHDIAKTIPTFRDICSRKKHKWMASEWEIKRHQCPKEYFNFGIKYNISISNFINYQHRKWRAQTFLHSSNVRCVARNDFNE